MLVLERYVGERLRIGDDMQVVVLSSRDGEVRLGVIAPRQVAVYREDVYRRIQAERQQVRPGTIPVVERRRRSRTR